MITAVFDCMVFLQAATNDQGPAFACVALAESNEVQLYVSSAILSEVQDVLSRPKIRAKFPHLTQERVDILLRKLATLAVVVNDISDAGIALRDPSDLAYLNLAVTANVGYLVSRDNDLLVLMNDPAITSNFPHLRIINPVSFLTLARSMKGP